MGDSENEIHELVREKYSAIAEGKRGLGSSSCCGSPIPLVDIQSLGRTLDYREEDLLLGPGEANLGLGCGNPIGMADLKQGEIVLDLGSGAGFDAFLAAKAVGVTGQVIGMDMTTEMVQKAKANARELNLNNVDFRLGKIETLPVGDQTVDVVISNCVINLSPDKSAVFGEIHRVLKQGGRIVISDVLRSGEIPEALKNDPTAYTGWVAGAISPDEVKRILSNLGFQKIRIHQKDQSDKIILSWNVAEGVEKVVFSAYILAVKP